MADCGPFLALLAMLHATRITLQLTMPETVALKTTADSSLPYADAWNQNLHTTFLRKEHQLTMMKSIGTLRFKLHKLSANQSELSRYT